MSNPRLTPQHRQHPAVANSAGHQVVAHKSTGGTLTSIPQPVDPVGNASPHLTNNTVALPLFCGRGWLSFFQTDYRHSLVRRGHQ